jgi:amidase
MSEIWRLSATAVEAALRAGEISATELTEAYLGRIDRLDGILKAFVTVDRDGAMAAARRVDALPRAGAAFKPLHGLPVAFKDLTATKGLRTTQGSLRFKDAVPDADDLVVARTRAASAIIIGKTNTPEFGFGAVCQNKILGPTLNPYDLRHTSGGSSGGAAVAVATGLAALAHGSDFGGSCRIPAAFCGVAGLRPTAGRIANPEKRLLWDDLAVHGVLARTVEDMALFLSVIGQPHAEDVTSLAADGFRLPAYHDAPLSNLRLAFKIDLGIAPIDSKVKAVVTEAIAKIGDLYPEHDEACPDFTGAMEAFMTLRGPAVFRNLGQLLESDRELLTPSVVWNIEAGRGVSADDYLRAQEERSRIFRSAARFFADHDFLVSATTSIAAFPNDESDVLMIDGKPMAHILDYAKLTAAISLIGLPALSIPCGFTADGLPVGIQIVGRPFDEARLLQFAYTLQETLGFAHCWPADPA